MKSVSEKQGYSLFDNENSAMNMLFLTERFPPSEGGSRVYYYNLCMNYSAGSVYVLTKRVEGYRKFDSRLPITVTRRGKPVSDWKWYRLPYGLPVLVRALYIVLSKNIKILHCGEFFPAGLVGLVLKKFLGIPYVYYVHGEAITWFPRFPRYYRLFKYLLRNADAIIAACSYAERGVRGCLQNGHGNIHKIMPGTDCQKFNVVPRDYSLIKALGLNERKIILTISRLMERKGHDTVIRALPLILAQVPNAVYLIGGRGAYEGELRRLVASLGLENHVRFLGFVPDDQVRRFYGICDVFVMANRDSLEGPEGFGMVFAEANACGKPVIGGRSGGTEDSILHGVTGFRVDPNDVKDLAHHVIKLLENDRLAREMGASGREWVEGHFNWREKAKALEAINASILYKRSQQR